MRYLLIIGSVLLYSCSGEEPAKINELEGDWMFMWKPLEITVGAGIRFKNDTLFYLWDNGVYKEGRYLVMADSIIVENFEKEVEVYRILEMSKDSLKLQRTDGSPIIYYSRHLEHNPNLTFDKITLKAGPCFGDCSIFVASFTDDGQIDFNGEGNCRYIGKKSFEIDQPMVEVIDSLFTWSYIEKLDTSRFYGLVDDWEIKLSFEYNQNKTITINGTKGHMPFRLKEIMNELMRILKEEELI